MQPQGLTASSFRALLARFDCDEQRAAEQYENLRQRLIAFLAKRRVSESEELADVVLDRLARRIEGGEVVDKPAGYAYGIARNVAIDAHRQQRRRARLLRRVDSRPVHGMPAMERSPVPACVCACACVARLSTPARQVLFDYSEESDRGSGEHRRMMAAVLGISPAALRLRVFRIRGELAECIKLCRRSAAKEIVS